MKGQLISRRDTGFLHKWFCAVLLALSVLNPAVNNSFAQSPIGQKRVTLDMTGASLSEVLGEIKSQTGVNFISNADDLNNAKRVNAVFTDTPIRTVLDRVMQGQNLSYKFSDDYVVISRKETPAVPVDKTVSGIVTDNEGNPLQGVVVAVKGGTTGIPTDAGGAFSLVVPDNGVLVFSHVSYLTKEVPVAGVSTLSVNLGEGVLIDKVVVTALNIKRDEKALGYAVQNVDGETLSTVKGIQVATSLTGRVAGLVVKNSTEFNANPVIEMRGESPMLVIDGVPYGNMTLRDIPADNISDISLLKGATAAALYGARGSAGAIIVTTKGAGAIGGLSVDVNSNTMFTLGYLAIPETQSSYGHGLNGAIANDYVWGPKLDIGTVASQWNPKTKQYEDMPLVSKGKNNLRNFMNPGLITNNTMSVTQTTDKGYLRTSFNHTYNKGQFPNQHLSQFNYSLSGMMKVNDRFSLESSMSYGRITAPQTWGAGYDNQGYVYQINMWTGPEYDIRDYRDYWMVENEKQNWLYDAWYDNPYMIAYEKLVGIEQNKMNANLTLNYSFLDNLKLTFRTGYDIYKDETTVRNPKGVNSTRGPVIAGSNWGFSANGFYGTNQTWGNSINSDVILNYNETFGNFNVDVLGGGTVYYYQDRTQGARTVNGLVVPGWYSLANAAPSIAAGTNAVEPNFSHYRQQVNSIYGKLSLSWRSAIFLDATGRNDWSSTQPAGQRSYFYPSLASSIVLSEFFKTPRWLGMWKVRGSWTITKTPLNVYQNNMSYTTSTSWGNTGASLPGNLQGSSLLPSESRTWEFGTAAYFFGKRLGVDIAYFSKLYYNMQINNAISPASGWESTLINTAETYARRGMEITLTGTPVRSADFEWNSVVNYSFNHKYYVDLDPIYSPNNRWTEEGVRTDYVIYDRMVMRDPQGNWIHQADGRVQLDTYNQFFGFRDPNFSFGFINNFRFRNWTMTVGIDGRVGGLLDAYIYGKSFDTGSNPETDTPERYDEVVNGGKYVGAGVKVVEGSLVRDSQGNVTSDTRVFAPNDIPVSYQSYMRHWGNSWDNRIRNATWLKVREVAISYSFPKEWLHRTGISNLQLSLTGQNLFLWTKDYKFADPDIDRDDMNAPSQRMVGLNIRIGF